MTSTSCSVLPGESPSWSPGKSSWKGTPSEISEHAQVRALYLGESGHA